MDRYHIQMLKEKVRLSEMLAPYVSFKRKGNEFWGCCPFHHEKTPSFKVNNDRGVFYCFGCHAQGDVFSFLEKKRGFSFQEALEEVARFAQVPLPVFEKNEPSLNLAPLLQALNKASFFYANCLMGRQGQKAQNYLKSRHITPPIARRFLLGYTAPRGRLQKALNTLEDEHLRAVGLLSLSKKQGKNDHPLSGGNTSMDPPVDSQKNALQETFKDRILFPLRNLKGQTIGFGGRTLGQSRAKYINSMETVLFKKNAYLYGLYEALSDTNLTLKPFVMVEGYFDVIALQSTNIARAVAPLGTALSTLQIEKALKHTKNLLFCFDGDDAGQRALVRAAELCLPLLTSERSFHFVTLPKGEDPQSMQESHRIKELETLFEKPISLIDVLFDHLCHSHTLKTPESKARAKRDYEAWCKTITDKNLYYFYRQAFSDKFYARLKGKDGHRGRTSLLNAKQPAISKENLKEKMALNTLLNHPQLIHRHAEAIAALELTPLLDTLKQGLLALAAANSLPEKPHILKERLCLQGFETHLLQLKNAKSLALYAPFSEEDAPLEKAEEGLVDLLKNFLHNRALKKEIKQAQENCAHHMHEKNWQHLKNLRTCYLNARS